MTYARSKLILCAGLVSLAPAAWSDPFFHVAAGPNFFTSPTPVQTSFTASDLSNSAAAAAGGTVGAQSFAALLTSVGFGFNQQIGEQSTANSSIDDIIFSGPASSVNATVTLPFDATFTLTNQVWSGLNEPDVSSTQVSEHVEFRMQATNVAPAAIDVTISTNQPTVVDTGGDSRITWTLTPTGTDTIFLSSTLFGDPIVGAQTTSTFQLSGQIQFSTVYPVGIPVFLNLLADDNVSVGANGFALGSGTLDALHTFGIVGGIPAFSLQDGFTVNAASIGLVDGITPSTATPEPTVAWLPGLVLAGAALRRLRRRRRPSTEL